MRNELYFVLRLTESEHYGVEQEIKDFINNYCDLNTKLIYYRKMKEGHVPMLREVKIKSNSIGKIKAFLKGEIGDSFAPIKDYIVPIPWYSRKDHKKQLKKLKASGNFQF